MNILVLPGDGIGPEITTATLAVLDRANAKFKLGLAWQMEDIGFTALKKRGSTLPDAVMAAARSAPGVILGPVSHLDYPPRDQGGINPSGELRVKLDLFGDRLLKKEALRLDTLCWPEPTSLAWRSSRLVLCFFHFI